MKKLYLVKVNFFLDDYDVKIYVVAQSYAEAEAKIIKDFDGNEWQIISIKLLSEAPIL